MWKIQNEITRIHDFATFYDLVGMAWSNRNRNNWPNSGAFAIFWLISAFVIFSFTHWSQDYVADIFKCIFFKEDFCILIKKYVNNETRI